MFGINPRQYIRAVRDCAFPPSFERRAKDEAGYCKGVVFCFDVSVHQYTNEAQEDRHDRRSVHVLIAGNHNIFMRHSAQGTFERFSLGLSKEGWKNVGNHDTCWIDSIESEFNALYFNMCKNVNPNVAPKSLSTNIFLGGLAGEPWVECKVKYSRLPGDSYFYALDDLKVE